MVATSDEINNRNDEKIMVAMRLISGDKYLVGNKSKESKVDSS